LPLKLLSGNSECQQLAAFFLNTIDEPLEERRAAWKNKLMHNHPDKNGAVAGPDALQFVMAAKSWYLDS
jgi:hypothetical protein